jgi:hypothetical protein
MPSIFRDISTFISRGRGGRGRGRGRRRPLQYPPPCIHGRGIINRISTLCGLLTTGNESSRIRKLCQGQGQRSESICACATHALRMRYACAVHPVFVADVIGYVYLLALAKLQWVKMCISKAVTTA